MLVAGVDSSTQATKVLIVSALTGERVRFGKCRHPEGTECPPEVWWNAFQAAVKDAGGLEDVAAISIGGQQHGMVALDADGKVVRPALLWNDTKSADAARDLVQEAGGKLYAEKIGIVPVTSFTASKLRWLKTHEPENAAKVRAVCLPHDYLTWRLLGYGPASESERGPVLEALVTDRSDASGTAYWSGVTGHYDYEMFKFAFGRTGREAASKDEGEIVLPRVLKPDERAGVAPSGLVVGPGAGDNAGGAIGLHALEGDVVVSIGTSGTVFTSSPYHVVDPTGTVCGFCDCTGQQLPLICTLNGARCIDAACKILEVDFDGLVDLVRQSEPGAGGLVLVPYFQGERTPNLPKAKGSLQNINLENATRPNIARAFVEGVVCSMADGLEAIRREIPEVPVKRLILIGGAAANPAVQECAAEIFDGAPVVVPTPDEYVARGGAAQAAWVTLGYLPDWKLPLDRELPPKTVKKVFEQYLSAKQAYFRS